MIFFHDVSDLIEVFLGQFIAVLKDRFNFVVDGVERVEILLLEMPLLGLVGQQRDFVCYLLVVFH